MEKLIVELIVDCCYLLLFGHFVWLRSMCTNIGRSGRLKGKESLLLEIHY